MKRIIIIIPYFGKLPSWFQLFLNSAKSNLVDFLFLTDDKTTYNFPKNFKVIYKSYEDFKEFFSHNAETDLYLDHPYKLCDYKPLYGKVFKQEIRGYEYWGFSDIDLIFGDIDLFIKRYINKKTQKIFRYGHFSLVRNDDDMNNLYTDNCISYNFNFVKQTSLPCHFDEISYNEIIIKNKKSYEQDQPFANINLNFLNFANGNGQPENPQLIVHDSGKLFIIEDTLKGITKKEVFYVHFMRRKNLPVHFSDSDRYIICRDGFINFDTDDDLKDLFLRYGNPVDKNREHSYRVTLKKNILKNKISVFVREFKLNNIRSIYNILFHYYLHKLWRY